MSTGDLFLKFIEDGEVIAIELLNSRNEVVGTLYMQDLDLEDLLLGSNPGIEKYFLRYKNILIYFTNYKKVY